MEGKHLPTAECADIHCYSCNEDEPITDNPFRVCGECGHVYQTGQELMTAYGEIGPPKVVDGYTIYFCPLCAHDF